MPVALGLEPTRPRSRPPQREAPATRRRIVELPSPRGSSSSAGSRIAASARRRGAAHRAALPRARAASIGGPSRRAASRRTESRRPNSRYGAKKYGARRCQAEVTTVTRRDVADRPDHRQRAGRVLGRVAAARPRAARASSAPPQRDLHLLGLGEAGRRSRVSGEDHGAGRLGLGRVLRAASSRTPRTRRRRDRPGAIPGSRWPSTISNAVARTGRAPGAAGARRPTSQIDGQPRMGAEQRRGALRARAAPRASRAGRRPSPRPDTSMMQLASGDQRPQARRSAPRAGRVEAAEVGRGVLRGSRGAARTRRTPASSGEPGSSNATCPSRPRPSTTRSTGACRAARW